MVQGLALPDEGERVGTREDLRLSSIARVWWYHRSRVILASVIMTSLAFIVIATQEHIYIAKALIKVDSNHIYSASNLSKKKRQKREDLYIESNIIYMRSNDFLKTVAKKADLYSDPEFLPEISSTVGGKGHIEAATQLTDNLADRLTVRQLGGSRVIAIEMRSRDSRKAARIANIAADTFVEEELKRLDSQEIRTIAWLSKKSRTMKFDLLALEGQALEVAGKLGFYDLGNKALFDQDLDTQRVALMEQLAIAKIDGTEIRAQLKVDALRDTDGYPAEKLPTIKSPQLQELKNVEITLLQRLSGLKQDLGPRHPKMISLERELDITRQRISVEQDRLQSKLRIQFQANSASQDQITSDLGVLEKSIFSRQKAHIELRDLKRRIDAGQRFLDRVLAGHQEISEKRAMQRSHVKTMSPASVPTAISYPVIWPSIAFVFLGIFLLNLLFVFFYERWISDFGFKDLKQVRGAGLDPLGVIPNLHGEKGGERSISTDALANPEPPLAEAFQKVRERVCYLRPEATNRGAIVMITSSAPSEGKTTTAVTLARQTAMAGGKVLLIDADIRHPTVHYRMGMANGVGLCELLSYKLDEEIKIYNEPTTGLDVLLAGKSEGSYTDLLRSSRMDDLLSEFRLRYDWIFMDSSSLDAVVDGVVLAKRVDLVIYIALWLRTPRVVLRCGIERLRDIGVQSIGVVLNRVDGNASEKYKELFEIKYHGYYQAFCPSYKGHQAC